jgi:hypothetical protein
VRRLLLRSLPNFRTPHPMLALSIASISFNSSYRSRGIWLLDPPSHKSQRPSRSFPTACYLLHHRYFQATMARG